MLISPAATLNPYIWLFGFVDAAGLINKSGLYPFQYRYSIYSATDCNTVTAQGVYKLGWDSNTGCVNFPSSNYLYGILLVFVANDAIVQIIKSSSGTWIRHFFDRWFDWANLES